MMRRLVGIDLDGTLLRSDNTLCPTSLQCLTQLHADDPSVLRVFATGRNWSAVKSVTPLDAPVDYVVVGSGGLTLHWATQQVSDVCTLCPRVARTVADHLVGRGVGFFLLEGPTHGHVSYAFRDPTAPVCPAWQHRHDKHPDTTHRFDAATLFDGRTEGFGQFLLTGVTDPDAVEAGIAALFPAGTVRFTRTTPRLGELWLEVLPADVSKSTALQRLAEQHGVQASVCIGNDFNDRDMIAWATAGCLVANTPPALLEELSVVPLADAPALRSAPPAGHRTYVTSRSNDEGGVAEALEHFLRPL